MRGARIARSYLEPKVRGNLRCSVELPVYLRVPHDGLHVLACLSKRNGFHEFRDISILRSAKPIIHTIGTRIVSGKGVLELTAEAVDHRFEVVSPKLQVPAWEIQFARAEVFDFEVSGDCLSS